MAHFKKLECFCFTEHVLKPGESKQWPVVFVVDRKLPKDVRTITLVVHLLRGRRQDAGRAVGAAPRRRCRPEVRRRDRARRRRCAHAGRRKASLARTLLAVVWSFFGVRKSSDLERDVSELNPLHVVIAGVVVAALFVVALIALVNWVIDERRRRVIGPSRFRK